MAYKFKYLKVTERPMRTGKVVCRMDVGHLNKIGREALWDRLDTIYPPEKFISCFEQTNEEQRIITTIEGQ